MISRASALGGLAAVQQQVWRAASWNVCGMDKSRHGFGLGLAFKRPDFESALKAGLEVFEGGDQGRRIGHLARGLAVGNGHGKGCLCVRR